MSYPIFIAPLPRHFTSADIAKLFRPFGNVVSAQVMYDSLGQSLQFGRAEMQTDETADEACRQLHNSKLHDANLVVMRAPALARN
jgi:RNA recognition motif-containing protein